MVVKRGSLPGKSVSQHHPSKVHRVKKLDNNEEISTRKKTTRICIKQLPPSISDATMLRNYLIQMQQAYFSKVPLTITDCKVLSKRRMAFVGCSTADAAEACVRYLHRCYCRSSRLIVEYALLPKETATLTDDNVESEVVKAANPKPEITDEIPSKSKTVLKKEEFLAAMGISSQTTKSGRVWSNDDGFVEPTNVNDTEQLQDHSADSSDSSDSDEDDANPLRKTPSTRSSDRQSDMDFLLSKTVAIRDFDATEDENDPDNHQNHSPENEIRSDEENEKIPIKPTVKKSEETERRQIDGEAGTHEMDNLQEDKNANENISSNRLFVRNLVFDTSEEDLKEIFSSFGKVTECHIPVDDQRKGKGYGFVAFETASDASSALQALDGTDFQGRLIHIMPARQAPAADTGGSHSASFKDRQEQKRRENSMNDPTGWSASHVRGDAVVDNLAARLGLRKGDILSVKDGMGGGDAAVRLALAETAIIEENRKYFAEHGIDMEALVSLQSSDTSQDRSKTAILVKNLPHDTTTEDLLKTFSLQGSNPSRILLPPSRTVAVVEYGHAHDAKRAFKRLAYRRFKNVPLYLEWAPVASVIVGADDKSKEDGEKINAMENISDAQENDEHEILDEALGPSFTVYVKNLSFSTTEAQLRTFFDDHVGDVRTVRIPQKVAPLKRKQPGESSNTTQQYMSMGYGFVEFKSQESARLAVKKLQGKILLGHTLELQLSRGASSGQQGSTPIPPRPPSKIMVRNVPFQANRKELLQLFGSFGQLKKARLPKKFDGNHRGFAFIEYVSGKEAAAAMKALSRTHLYGRHLVLEWAETDDEETRGLRVETDNSRQADESLTQENKKIRFD